jgi:hypothetical protein
MIRKASIISHILMSLALSLLAQQPAPAPQPAPVSQPPAPQPVPQPAPSADDIARRAVELLGGSGAWERARYFAFSFNVEREGKVVASFPQRWDRYNGDYHVSGKKQDGTPFDVTLNVNSKMSRGSLNGVAVTDNAQFKDLFELGYRRFINDTYWLLMPLKMFDPGVHRTYDGERVDSCGHTWDLVKLSFDPGVGLTPGDVYWPWINRDTGVVEEWDMKLQSMKPEDPPLQVLFHDYRRIGGLLISIRREIRGRGQVIRLDDIQILPEVPKGAFE